MKIGLVTPYIYPLPGGVNAHVRYLYENLIARGHERVLPPAGVMHRALMGGGQAIMIDPDTGALVGASDIRKDGLAIGY